MRFENPIDYVTGRSKRRSYRGNPTTNQHVFMVVHPESRDNLATTTVYASSDQEAQAKVIARLARAGLKVAGFGQVIPRDTDTLHYVYARYGGIIEEFEPARAAISELGPIPLAEVAAVVVAPPAIVPQPPMPPGPPLFIQTSGKVPPASVTSRPKAKKKPSLRAFAAPPSPTRGTVGERSRKRNPYAW